MQAEVAQRISEKLFDKFGIELHFETRGRKEGDLLILRPAGIFQGEGFNIKILVGWKKLTIEFLPEDNAGQLLLGMEHVTAENIETFRAINKTINSEGGLITMSLNGVLIKPDILSDWPDYWKNLQLLLKSPFIKSDTDLALDENLEGHILKWATLFFSLMMSMLPIVEQNEDLIESNAEGLLEGAQKKIIVNRYERSKANRQMCIAVYGPFCIICGFDFGKQYGPEGEGYIEVHHVTPVSKIGKDYKLNPVKDLIPVCANCHAMIHRRNPPYSVDEVKNLITASRSK